MPDRPVVAPKSDRLVISPGMVELLELAQLGSLSAEQVERATVLARQLGTTVVLRRVDLERRIATRYNLQTGAMLGEENL